MYYDKFAIKRFEEIAKENKFTIFETGTHLGNGTLFFLNYRDEVITTEIHGMFHAESMTNWKQKGFKIVFEGIIGEETTQHLTILENGPKRIYSFFGDSADTINIVCKYNKFKRPFFFFLDAHWDWRQTRQEKYWPILNEMKMIAKHKLSDSIIIIDDFKHDKGFGYDSIHLGGKEIILDWDYVKDDMLKINKDYKIGYNQETVEGIHGRGLLYAFPK